MMVFMKWVAWTALLAFPVRILWIVGRRELGGTAIMVIFFVWLDFLKDPSHSGLPYTGLECNVSDRI
jgi:hypothetical protein